MDFIIKVATYLNNLPKKQFQKLLLIVIVSAFMVIIGMLYFIHSKSIEYADQIKKLENLSNKAVLILEDNQKMEVEALRIQVILDQNKEFNIKSYFEIFCQQNSLTPNQGWEPRTDELNERFDEILLSASFKSLTTEKIVKIVEDFYKKEIIYIKSMSIKQESEKKVSFEITIATKAIKRGFETR
ncbi:MAG: hypothetical protein US49_C0006G0107 [candidate division TM6 bacterium GW2011_GWF2_37_49]|nr:MAG: hypothetical protein US49_C0006G0107 [candidate division TM6 bacterium GW2011_GWF2_37_49]